MNSNVLFKVRNVEWSVECLVFMALEGRCLKLDNNQKSKL